MIKSNLLYWIKRYPPPHLQEHLFFFVKYVYIQMQTASIWGAAAEWKRNAHTSRELNSSSLLM